MSDGRRKKTYSPEEAMDNLSYCSFFKQFVGWISGHDELFVSIYVGVGWISGHDELFVSIYVGFTKVHSKIILQ